MKNDWLEILVYFEKLIVAILMYCMMAGLKYTYTRAAFLQDKTSL